MRKRSAILLALVLVAALGAATFAFFTDEPSYDGKALSDWIVVMRDGPDREKGREVVHRLGPKALPLLLKWLDKEDSPTLLGRINNLKERADWWLMDKHITGRHSVQNYWDAKSSYRSLGVLALEELGPEARAAIPTLIKMLGEKSHKSDESVSLLAGSAYCILPHMAPDSIPPLIQALSSPDEQVRLLAAGALANIGPRAKGAIPVFEKWLNDPNVNFQVVAADVLGSLGGDTNKFVPVLIQALRHRENDAERLYFKLQVLLRYKDHARPALPALHDLLSTIPPSNNESNNFVRQQILSAIQQIETEGEK